MYQLLSEIKKQQRVINKKVKKILEWQEAHCNPCSDMEKSLIIELERQLIIMNRRLKELLELQERHTYKDDHVDKKDDSDHKTDPDDKPDLDDLPDSDQNSPPEPEPPDPPQPVTQNFAYGFAYTLTESNENGAVSFQIAGPMHEVQLTSEGLVVANSGVYQIQYAVQLQVLQEELDLARFQLVINDSIHISTSVTESALSQQLNSTQLFSLREGDIVKLVAEVEGMSYSNVSLQVLQVG